MAVIDNDIASELDTRIGEWRWRRGGRWNKMYEILIGRKGGGHLGEVRK